MFSFVLAPSPMLHTLAVEWGNVGRGALATLFIVVCVLMILAVLIQKPQGGGLAGAFGGSNAGSGQTAFGAKTGDALTVFTVAIFVLFVGTAIALNFTMKPTRQVMGTEKEVSKQSKDKPAESGTSTNAPAATLPASSTGEPAGATLPVTTPAAPAPQPATTTPANTTPITPAPVTPIKLPDPVLPTTPSTPAPTPTTPAPTPAPSQPK